MQMDLYKKVSEYMQENQMLRGIRLILAGVSGGPDSMAMLELLLRILDQADVSLWVVHVNHGIRGAEAWRDQRYVEEFCREKGISCSVYAYDVPGMAAEKKMGHEEMGRLVRKEAFAKEMLKSDIPAEEITVALAHNRNDLAETMLHHLSRGSGIRGLSSMRPVGKGIIRPLLCLERREIEEYVRARKIPSVLDHTNLEDLYTRNRIRNHILPLIQQEINPQAVRHMAAASETLALAEDYFSEKSAELAEKLRESEKSFLLSDDFFEKEEILQRYIVRRILEILAGRQKDLELTHVKEILLLYKKQTGRSLSLPCNIQALRCYEGVRICPRTETDRRQNLETNENIYQLPKEGEMNCPFGRFQVRTFPYTGQKIFEKKYTKWFDCDRIKCSLAVRTRKTGDYLILNQAGEHKKLTRYMIDARIPADRRDQIPVVAAGSEILWILGGRISESYKISSQTREVLEISCEHIAK